MGEARPHPGQEQRAVKDQWVYPCQDQQMAEYSQEPTTNPFIPTTPPTLLWRKSGPLGAPRQPSWPAATHTPFLCLRLSQVPGGCSELRHVRPLQKDPHLSGYGG